MTKQVSVRWHGELDFDAADEAGAIVPMSTKDEAVSPTELLLAALGGCTGMDAVSVMTKKKVDFDTYQVEITGEQRDGYPHAFTHIVVEHIVDGRGISDKAVSRSIELSARTYCAVGATIATGDCAVNHRMRITDEAGERTSDCVTVGPRGAGLSHYENA